MVVIAGVAFATSPQCRRDDPRLLQEDDQDTLRVINVEAGQKCRSDEYTLNWNTGRAGRSAWQPWAERGNQVNRVLPGTPSVSIVGGHANNFNISSDTYTYIDSLRRLVVRRRERVVEARAGDAQPTSCWLARISGPTRSRVTYPFSSS